MPKKIVVHLGVHKTATTSQQGLLKKNRKALAKAGVSYTPLAEMREFVTPLIRSMKRTERTYLGQIVRTNKKPVILWSDETILGWTKDIKSDALYEFAFPRATRLCEQFPKKQFHFVLTLRTPSAYLSSMYREFIKHAPYETFSSYCEAFDVENFSFKELFSWVYKLPSNAKVTIIPYEKAFGGGPEVVIDHILDLSCGPDHGIDVTQMSQFQRRVSFNAEELALTEEIANVADPKTAMHFLELIEKKKLRFGETSFSPLPSALKEKIDQRYLQDLKDFAKKKSKSVTLLPAAKKALKSID